MTHEFKQIILDSLQAQKLGLKTVLASVVALDGSSYRKPGVRMLIREDGAMTCAVSGGCVEKEIQRQAAEVFEKGKPRMMLYDGRYRLGCEGTLYVLIEPFNPDQAVISTFQQALKNRSTFTLCSSYKKDEGLFEGMGTAIQFGNQLPDTFQKEYVIDDKLPVFIQEMQPCFKLVIFGMEHDAMHLCSFAAATGWEVIVVAPPKYEGLDLFAGAEQMAFITPEEVESLSIDHQTALVLMTHNFALDIQYILHLRNTRPAYIGLLGPVKRRNKLLDELIIRYPDIDEEWIDLLHGPAGLNIGSVTPQEIAISIIGEILSVVRKEQPMYLKEKSGSIHATI